MTATTLPLPAGIPAGARLTFGGVLKSEWIKFTSLRSTFWLLASTAVVMVGMSALFGLGVQDVDASSFPPNTIPGGSSAGIVSIAATALVAVPLAQLIVGIAGALIISGEYATGQVRSTFAAAPGRVSVIVCKALVLGLITLVLTFVASQLGAFVLNFVAPKASIPMDWSDPDQVRIALAIPLVSALIAVLSIGIGTLVRSSPAAIGIVVAVFFVLPLVTELVPLDLIKDMAPFLPAGAVSGALALTPPPPTPGGIELSSWQSFAILAGWAVLVFAAGAISLKRRDA